MKLQIEPSCKTITVEAPVDLKHLLAELDLIFPDFRLWKDTWVITIIAPATITWNPNLPVFVPQRQTVWNSDDYIWNPGTMPLRNLNGNGTNTTTSSDACLTYQLQTPGG